ncbi:hypothetical protein BD408DRAFT_450829 [Parasitella parasitica]|nr:hypothetical protein BD408DRAFT_450829 [Parasitella parasitica]
MEEGQFNHTQVKIKPTRMERFMVFLSYARPLLTMLFFDVGLPLAVYYILKLWLSVLISLVLSGIPPLLRAFYIFCKRRHIDILGCICVFSFILSAILSIINGDARLTLLRNSTITAVVSFMFFVTLIPIETKWLKVRPIFFLFSLEWVDKQGVHYSLEIAEWTWQHVASYRKFCYILSAMWGSALLGHFVAKIIMIKSTLDIDHVILYGNVIIICVMVSMTLGTFLVVRFVGKKTAIELQIWYKQNMYIDKSPSENL